MVLLSGWGGVTFRANAADEASQLQESKTDRYIRFVYNKIKFPKNNKLRFEVFRPAFYGYLNMLEEGKIQANATLSVCDFTLSSNVKRLWVIDLKNKKVVFNTLVAHGAGTGEEYAQHFSNIEDSHQSSLGFYTTEETYSGNNGYSLKLHGVDGKFNDKAYDRAIVIHGADYVSEEFAKANQRLGRSHGCPALPVALAPKIIDRIKGGQCLFIYHSSSAYLKNSHWLTSKLKHLPEEADMMDFNFPSNTVAGHSNQEEVEDDSALPMGGDKQKAKSSAELIPEKKVERKITSIIVIKENYDGTSDTTIVK
ncbi:MAG: murein L,D-transpeptidase catalytic domain family protein [Chitinophagaceae bacterium]|nr:murein L,D-transpeptidase catalytic domain family protein [Chitinophagaceae bacterium]